MNLEDDVKNWSESKQYAYNRNYKMLGYRPWYWLSCMTKYRIQSAYYKTRCDFGDLLYSKQRR